jgi:hypothetical protein
MRNAKGLWSFAILTIAASVFISFSYTAELPTDGAVVSIGSPPSDPLAGSAFTVPVDIHVGISPLGTYTLELHYDPSVITINSIAGGSVPEFSTAPMANPATFNTGSTRFNAVNFLSLTTPTGQVNVANVTFNAVGNAGENSNIDLVVVTLRDTDAVAIPVDSVIGGFVTIFADTTPPVITLEGDNSLTLEVGTPYTEPGWTATDNYDGEITGNVVVTGSVNHTVLGSYLLHYNVSDSSGNPAVERTRTVNMIDTTVPVIALSGATTITLEVGTPYFDPGWTASDNYDGDISANIAITGTVDCDSLGTYTLRYSVSDSSGNPAEEKTRTVNVVDTTAPVIILSGANPVTLEVGISYVDPTYTATDNYDGDITGSVVVTGLVDHTALGSYVLYYNVSDSSGNPAEEKTRRVNVVDTTSPMIALSGDNPLAWECGTPFADPGYTASDNYDGDITDSVAVTGSVDHTALGSYVLKYNVSDSSGNPAAEKARIVNIVDTTPPVITLLGDNPLPLECGTPYVEPGYTATDVCQGDLTDEVVVTESVDYTTLGTYVLQYNVNDSSGNAADKKTRTVEVGPVIEKDSDSVSLNWISQENQTYVIWSSPDLTAVWPDEWTEEATIYSEAELPWIDPDPLSPMKFYRVEIR